MDESPDRSERQHEPAALTGRTVLVTGGGHRVGEAISRGLAERGARVIVHYHRSAPAAERLAGELPHGALALAADLAQAEGPARLLAACVAAGALPDAVVHSAASFLRRSVADTSAADWDAVFALNLRAFFLLARELAALHPRRPAGADDAPPGEDNLARRPADRNLIAISDSGAYELWTGYVAHCVAKAALLPLVRLLAKALAPEVRVNAVVPGPVLPEPDSSAEEVAAMERRTLLGRLGDPADVASAVAFLLANPFATGTVLEVTGGAHLWRGNLDRD